MALQNNFPNVHSILLLGTNNILALPVIRSIAAVMPQAQIHTLSYRNHDQFISEHSRYVHTRHYLEPHLEEEELYPILLQKIEETNAGILLPIDEEDVKKAAGMKEQLTKHIHLPPLPDPQLFNSLVFKNRLVGLLQNHSIPHPQTYLMEHTDPHEISPSFFPGLLKPTRGSAGQGIKKVDNLYQLRQMLQNNQSTNYILQEIIPGTKIICNLLAEDGHIHALNIQEGIESRNYSFSTAIKFIENQQVEATIQKLIQRTGYSGLANIDFLIDERDGKPKLVDFNPRFWSSLSGSKAAGIDFTHMACLAALGQTITPPQDLSPHYGLIYHMGRSTFKHMARSMNPFSRSGSDHVTTDLRERLLDPLPEIMRLLQ